VCWIAAHALEHQMPVVTTDRSFRRLPGLRVHVVASRT
jgi:predicted nucleic acid-binding protein